MSKPKTYGQNHFQEFTPKTKGILSSLEKEAKRKDIPIVGPVVGRLLYILAKAMSAKRVLELGTATGYSAIWLGCAASSVGGKVISVERDPILAAKARLNIRKARLSETVEIKQGDAHTILAHLTDKFDFMFLDVEKEMYSSLLNPCMKSLRPGGIMLFDNTSFRTAGDFLRRSFEHPSLETLHLHCYLPGHDPDLDALTICLKKGA